MGVLSRRFEGALAFLAKGGVSISDQGMMNRPKISALRGWGEPLIGWSGDTAHVFPPQRSAHSTSRSVVPPMLQSGHNSQNLWAIHHPLIGDEDTTLDKEGHSAFETSGQNTHMRWRYLRRGCRFFYLPKPSQYPQVSGTGETPTYLTSYKPVFNLTDTGTGNTL